MFSILKIASIFPAPDDSGSIAWEEMQFFIKCLSRVLVELKSEKTFDKFKAMDKNNDGDVTLCEFQVGSPGFLTFSVYLQRLSLCKYYFQDNMFSRLYFGPLNEKITSGKVSYHISDIDRFAALSQMEKTLRALLMSVDMCKDAAERESGLKNAKSLLSERTSFIEDGELKEEHHDSNLKEVAREVWKFFETGFHTITRSFASKSKKKSNVTESVHTAKTGNQGGKKYTSLPPVQHRNNLHENLQ